MVMLYLKKKIKFMFSHLASGMPARGATQHLKRETSWAEGELGTFGKGIWRRRMKSDKECGCGQSGSASKLKKWGFPAIFYYRIHAMLEKDAEMAKFFDDLEDEGPIRLRDAFYGGRTGAEWLYASANEDTSEAAVAEAIQQYKTTGNTEKIHRTIKFKDVKSLYPAM
jgi:hypothetical protein